MEYYVAIFIGAVIGYWIVQRVKYSKINKIDVNQLESLLNEKNKDNIFIDVREVDEYKKSKVKGMRNIPVSQLKKRLKEIAPEKSVYTFCHSGRRSMIAAKILVRSGYKDVTTVKGGIEAWHRRNK